MAETSSKRQREETHVEDFEDSKRHKSYSHILSILEDEEDEPNQDLSSILTTLQQELACDSATFDHPLPGPTSESETDPENPLASSATYDYSPASNAELKEDEEEDRERVIRHLLEASDDELGIPNIRDGGDVEINGQDHAFALCDGFWEFEDEAANYYTLLQSELFMPELV
ncbi:hypothetical protein F0562_032888 [Nyssa sinensis]|uniref:Uncharacterized protein n=1 Tax=Nyssa sinensis TaxID=561372 RepID=A0A5J5APF2_9ASTE|nr:hypothetical protein F0562_032888 [Nyssa sinensis]